MTLLQSIDKLLDNISVTDRQEENIKNSVSNLDGHLTKKDNGLHIKSTFTNGSWDRDTILRPLDDIDIFAVLDEEEWKDDDGKLPSPQSVLTKFKNYLNDVADYKDKVSQDRPCVTIRLSDKDFDVLPSFAQTGGGYLMPNYDLQSWTYTYPEKLTEDLDSIHRNRGYKVKPTIKAVKYWNREHDKYIPSYHVEEVAISIFQLSAITNYEHAIRKWFNSAEYYLDVNKFKSKDQYDTAVARVRKVKDKLNDAFKKYEDNKEDEAKEIWKEVFGKEFPSVYAEEAKNYSKAMSEGSLRSTATGTLSTAAGTVMAASKGFFGDVHR